MASIVDELVSHGSDFDLLDDEQAARSIVIKNIPEEAREVDIIIHFQKRKNGGGDIDHLHIIENTTTAVVTFDSDEVARSVLEKPQRLEGTYLELKPYQLPAKAPEVFGRVSARIEPDVCCVSPRVLRKYLERVESEMTVKHHEASDWFIVSSTFEEISQYRERLQTFLAKDGSLNGPKREDDKPSNTTEKSETENIVKSLEVVPKFMKLLQLGYRERIDVIESRSPVELVWHEGSNKVEIKRRPGCSTSQYKEGVDSFINLYQKLYPDMKQEAVEMDANDDVSIEKAAKQIMERLPVFIEKGHDKWTVYGESSVIPKAVSELKEALGLITGNGRSSRRQWDAQGNTRPDKHSCPPTSPQSSREFSAPLGTLQHVLTGGITISVLQGDITLQRVDAIVNAANANLEHGGGVAGAIVSKGGFQIQEDSRRIVRHQGSVPVGAAVYTAAGKLSCKVVIHAVGPRWDKNNKDNSVLLLHLACISGLRLAACLRMTSIAIPAISSGIFGMPKQLCAETMFNAVQEFSNSVDCKLGSIRDVHFVNIDDETVMVFKKEFLKRYESNAGTRSDLHPKTVILEDLSHSNNKPLTSEPANQAASIDRPGHVERVVQGAVKKEQENNRNPTIPKLDEHRAYGNDSPVSTEQGGMKGRSDIDDSSQSKGTANTNTHAQFGKDDVTATGVNNRKSPPTLIKEPESNSRSSDPIVQGLLTPERASEATESGEDKDNAHTKAKGTNQSTFGTQHAKTAGRGRARILGHVDVRLPPGLASSNEGKQIANQFSTNSDNQGSTLNLESNQDPLVSKKTERPAENESRASDLSCQRSGSKKPIELTSSTRREEGGSVPTVTILPHFDNKPLTQDQPVKEEKHKYSNIPNPDEHQTSSNESPVNPEEYSRVSTFGVPGGKESRSERADSDCCKGAAHSHFVDEREDNSNNSKCIEQAEVSATSVHIKDSNPSAIKAESNNSSSDPRAQGGSTSSKDREEDESLPTTTTSSAVNKLLPQDGKGTDETNSTGQSKQETSHCTDMDEPRPLGHGNSHQEQSELKSDLDVDGDYVLDDKNTYETNGGRRGSDDRQPDLRTMETPDEVDPSTEDVREKNSPEGKIQCSICLGPYKDPKYIAKCGHTSCGSCVPDNAFHTREVCQSVQSSTVVADQPIGCMNWYVERGSLPGFGDCDTIVVKYNIPDGIQGEGQPNPGKPYVGVSRTAYIPNSAEGREVLQLLVQAFDARLVFTLNKPPTEEGKNLVIWNTIHHKTNCSGGPTNNGYPDPQYLNRVKRDLAALGIHKVI